MVANAIHEKTYTAKDLVFQNDRWHCFDAHSKLSALVKKDVLLQLNKAIAATNTALERSYSPTYYIGDVLGLSRYCNA